MSSEELNKMSNQTPSQGSPSDPRNEEDYDTWEYGTEPVPGDDTWANLLDKTEQFGNPFAEDLWEMEKKKAKQKERNTRHSVDKSEDFIKSGMTLITDVESDKYLKKIDK
jgi:hypothetical protein